MTGPLILASLAFLYTTFWALFTPAHYDGHILLIAVLYGAAVGAWWRRRRDA